MCSRTQNKVSLKILTDPWGRMFNWYGENVHKFNPGVAPNNMNDSEMDSCLVQWVIYTYSMDTLFWVWQQNTSISQEMEKTEWTCLSTQKFLATAKKG
jgi:hypothetical protein